MATESWVTIGGFIATTASAIAAFFAVKQTMLQRTISTKPQIIVSNQEVKTILSENNTFALVIEDSELYYDIPILIKNVGLGTALNIQYNWSFDYQKHIKLCGFKETKEDPILPMLKAQFEESEKYFHFETEKNSNYKYFKFIKYGKFNYYGLKKVHNELEYIMPVTQESTSSKIEFPSLICLLLADIAYSSTVSDNSLFNKMDAGKLHIKYEDISGNKIHIYFNCFIQLIRFQSKTEKGPRSTFRIEFNRIHTGSKFGLQRLRKSYANFVSEYNLNKNN